jgi:hypothetical protein
MAPKYKFIYFNSKALGEPIRWLFAFGGIEYEDFRFKSEEWPQIKPCKSSHILVCTLTRFMDGVVGFAVLTQEVQVSL